MTNHVVIYSGGMDSFTLLHWVLQQSRRSKSLNDDDKVYALSFFYGQRHQRELGFAGQVCAELGIPHRTLDIMQLRALAPRSSLTGPAPVPHGHYAAESMKATVVPGRNTVMLAMALAYAEGMSDQSAVVYYGAHGGDHHIYPDCRPEFFSAMAETIKQASDGRVTLLAPFMHFTKTSLLTWGLNNGLTARDYGQTYSCYEGRERPCGQCGACQERAEAFRDNGVVDPWFAFPG